jgi:hypothetical protein
MGCHKRSKGPGSIAHPPTGGTQRRAKRLRPGVIPFRGSPPGTVQRVKPSSLLRISSSTYSAKNLLGALGVSRNTTDTLWGWRVPAIAVSTKCQGSVNIQLTLTVQTETLIGESPPCNRKETV